MNKFPPSVRVHEVAAVRYFTTSTCGRLWKERVCTTTRSTLASELPSEWEISNWSLETQVSCHWFCFFYLKWHWTNNKCDGWGPKGPSVGNLIFQVGYIFNTKYNEKCSQHVSWRLDKNSIFYEILKLTKWQIFWIYFIEKITCQP